MPDEELPATQDEALAQSGISATPIGVSAVVIMAGMLLSRIAGLLREQITAWLYGTGDDTAAFTVAENVLNMLLELTATGMLHGALIPVLAALLVAENGIAAVRHVSGALLALVALILTPLVLLAVVASPQIVDLMTAFGGTQDRDAATVELTVDLVRILLPAIWLLAPATILMACLYALQRPAAPAFAGAVRNFGVIIVTILLTSEFGIKGLAIGGVAGSALMLLSLIWPLRKQSALPQPNFDFRNPAVVQTIKLFLPIFLGLLVSTAVVILDRNLAWRADEDALGAMRFATMVAQLLVGLVAAAVSLAVLPRLAGMHAEGNIAEFDRVISSALRMVSYLMIPAVMITAALASPIVAVLFEHGNTTPANGDRIALALLGYLPGHLMAAFDQVLIVAFYARQNTWLPVSVGVLSAVVFIVSAVLLSGEYGMMGLVVANTIQFTVHALIMFWLLYRHVGIGSLRGMSMAVRESLVTGLVVATAAGAAYYALDWLLPDANHTSAEFRTAVLLLISLCAGGLSYAAALRHLQVPEIERLVSTLQAKVRPAA